jgi:hypothetical protein
MADVKISALPAAGALAGTEPIPTVQTATTVATTPAALKTYMGVSVAAGKTLTASNSLTLAGTDATTMTFPTATDTVAGLAAVQTVTGAWSFNDSKLILKGATSGTTTLKATAAAGATTATFPAANITVAANDGSNLTITGQAIGDIPVASSTTAYGKLAAVATGSVLLSKGTGTAPAWGLVPSRVLGYTEVTTNGTVASATLVTFTTTPLAVTFTAPGSRDVIVTVNMSASGATTGDGCCIGVQESTTVLGVKTWSQSVGGNFVPICLRFKVTAPSAGSHTYTVMGAEAGARTLTMQASALGNSIVAGPASILVELA